MNRKAILSTIIGVLVTIAAYSGAAWWIGKSAEQTIRKQIDWLKTYPYLTVKQQTYERGWFSSEAVTVFTINPTVHLTVGQQTDTINVPMLEMTYKQRITHGPLPLIHTFNFIPYKAVVLTEFIFPPEVQKFLSRFFGQNKPINMVERIAFNADSTADITIPAFDYEEAISGIKVKWAGFTGTMEYNSELANHFKLHGAVPRTFIEGKPKGELNLNNLTVDIDNVLGKSGLMIGSHGLAIDNLDIKWLDRNPLHVTFDKLAYGSKLSETNGYINAEGRVGIVSFRMNEKTYGPIRFLGEAKHLHAPTLLRMSNEITQRQQPADTAGETGLTEQNFASLLAHSPEFVLHELFVKTPDGDIRVSANVTLKEFVNTDLDNPIHLFNKIEASANIAIPRQVLETVIAVQARDALSGDQPANNKDMELLLRQMVEGQINKLAQEQFIRLEGNNVITNMSLKHGTVSLNGKTVLLN